MKAEEKTAALKDLEKYLKAYGIKQTLVLAADTIVASQFEWQQALNTVEKMESRTERLQKEITELKDELKFQAVHFEDENAQLKQENERLTTLINTPEIEDFQKGVQIEAAHQTERWGLQENYYPHHFILVLSKLTGKLSVAIFDEDVEKFKHHLITIAAVTHNVHRQIEKNGTAINEYFLNQPRRKVNLRYEIHKRN